MAKKKIPKDKQLLESNNSIIAELRNDRWIYNPVVYSQLRGDFSLWQQRVLIGIVERLQQRIINSIEEQKKTKAFPDIFDVEELKGNDNLELKIPLKDLGVDAYNYDKLEQAAAALIGSHMTMPVYSESGKKYESTAFITLFTRLEIPRVESMKDGQVEQGRRQNFLRVVMSKENLRSLFSMQQGYIRHLSQIALLAQKKRTPRIYILLSRYKDSGHKQVPYNDLLEYLGLTDEFYLASNTGTSVGARSSNVASSVPTKVVNPFNEWNRVKSQVLVPVQKEMKDLADAGDIDIWFDFEPVYPYGKKRGTPLAINFTIYKSVLGEQRSRYDHKRNAIYQWIDTYVRWCPDISQYDLLQLVNDMSDKQLKDFLNYAYKDMRKLVDKVHPDDVAAYTITCLKRWKQQYAQQDLFSQMNMQEEIERRRKEEKERKHWELKPGDKAEQWQMILSRCSPEYREHLSKATHEGTSGGYLSISFDTREELEAFNNFELDKANKPLADAFQKLMKEIFVNDGAWRVLRRGLKKQ